MEAGRAAGVQTCAVTWGAHDTTTLAAARPDALVHDVSALQHLLLSIRQD
ncbi:MAG: HAD family hydrolase [Cardiobacterium sp.]